MSCQQHSASQQVTTSQAQTFWLQWLEAAFPDLDSRPYFLPPVCFNRVPMTRQSVAGQEVLVLQSAPGQAGQSKPGQAGQSTPGQAGQSTPGQAGQSTPAQSGHSTPGQVGQSPPGQVGQSPPGQVGQSTPGQAGQSTPAQSGHSTPGQAGQSTPGQPGQSTARQAGQSTPGQVGQSPPGQVGQSTPGQAGQSPPGQVGQSTPGQAGQSTPGQPGQSTARQAGQSTPGQAGQSTSGLAGQSTPVQSGHSTPGQPGQSTARQASQSTPGQVGQSTARQAGQSTPGQVGQSTPGQTGQTTPAQSCQSTPGQPSQSTPGQGGQSTPGQAGQSTPGQVGQSTPGQPGQSTPGQPGQSTPGQVGQSTPGQVGQSKAPALTASTHPSMPQPPPVQDSDVRDDAAMQRVLVCLQEMAEKTGEVLVGLTQLQFGQYLGEPCYAAAAALLPLPANLSPALPRNWKRGDFDVLLIHRQYGFVVCEVKAFGDNVRDLNMPQNDIATNIRKKLKQAVSQLDKAEAMLSHLVSDIASGLRITKTIAVPNLTTRQVQQAISGDLRLTQELCRCLGTTDPSNITGLCLCSDQLSDPKTPWDVSSDVLRELGNWWQRRVAVSGPDSHMTCNLYKTLVARFCGPATTVTVPSTSAPRLCVKTLSQVVSLTGELYTAQITLFPEQVHLLNTAPPRLFVTGPPGTGKTVVLLLMAMQWLRYGNNVCVVSTWHESRAACIMLYHLLLQIVNTQLSIAVPSSQLCLLEYELIREDENDLKKFRNDLELKARGRPLCVIADEMTRLTAFHKLLARESRLPFWAASCYHGDAPPGWQVEYLTRPLRSPPTVVREVQQDTAITAGRLVLAYSERGVPDHTGGPQVIRLSHIGYGHSPERPYKCYMCGGKVARFLQDLHDRVPAAHVTSTICSTSPPCLQWRDMLVLCPPEVSALSGALSGALTALSTSGIPVRLMTNDDIEDVATARSDVVWVVSGDLVKGLERKVVVCLNYIDSDSNRTRLHHLSRCTSQLVIVERPPEGMKNSYLLPPL